MAEKKGKQVGGRRTSKSYSPTLTPCHKDSVAETSSQAQPNGCRADQLALRGEPYWTSFSF